MEPETEFTGGDVVAQFLGSVGVADVYGIPGGHTLSLNEGLHRAGLRFLTVRNEYSACCAAAAVGRLTGRAGIALVTCGPGVTNSVTGLAASLRDGNPMVLISVNNRGEHIGWGDAQDADAVAATQSVTKWSVHVSRAQSLAPTLMKAWRIAHSDRPGPVHIDLARDVAEGRAAARIPAGPLDFPTIAPRLDAATLADVAQLLTKAERPVLWIGRGALDALHDGRLASLVAHLRIPVVATFNAMEGAGAFGELSFGVLSRVGTRLSKGIVEDADLVICLGNSLNGVSTKRWALKLPRRIQVDIRSDRISAFYPPEIAVLGDAGSFCDGLRDAVAPSAKWAAWLDECRNRRAAWRSEVEATTEATGAKPISPLRLMRVFARHNLDDGQLWTIDASNPGIWAHVLSFRNGARVLRPVNYSNMGSAIGSAIGYALAGGGNRIVNVLIGDGSLGMVMGDLETVRRLGARLRIFVMNDSSLSNIRQEVDYKYRREEAGFSFIDVRFDRVAEGFGIPAIRVESEETLDSLLRNASESDLPCLYDLRIDGGPSVWTDMV